MRRSVPSFESDAASRPALRILRPIDAVIAVVLLVGAAFFLPILRSRQSSTVLVYRDNHLAAKYPLRQPREFTVAGRLGPMVIAIGDEGVRIKKSPCRGQICFHSGTIRSAGRQIVCVPSHIIVEIKALSETEDVDAVSE